MRNDISIQAFIDGFNYITVYVLKSFYGGNAKDFYITDNKTNNINNCKIISKDEDNLFIKYKLSFDFEIDFVSEYFLSCNHGFLTFLQYRYIVKDRKFDDMFYYNGKLGSSLIILDNLFISLITALAKTYEGAAFAANINVLGVIVNPGSSCILWYKYIICNTFNN